MVVLTGDVDDSLLAGLARSPNVSVARAPASEPADAGDSKLPAVRPGWEPGALAMAEAARRASTYVIVPDDPLADVAAGWSAMWDVASGPAGPAGFEHAAAEALAAWRGNRFELPDYYLVTEGIRADTSGGPAPDMYLGPLRAVRPRRIAVAGIGTAGVADAPVRVSRVIEALRTLEHGPWWPPLDDLLDATRHFYAGGLAETQLTL